MAAACEERAGSNVFRGNEGHVIRAGDEQLIFVIRLAALERNFVPRRTGHRAEAVERAGYAHEGQGNFVKRTGGEAKLVRALRRETENCFRSRIGKAGRGMIRQIDKRAADGLRGIGTHGVTGNANAIQIQLVAESANPLLQIRKRVQKKSNVLRPAFPQSRIFQRFTHGLRKPKSFVTTLPALNDGIVVCGLQRDVAVSGPMAGQRFATVLRAACSMRKHDYWVLALRHRIKNADVQVFIASGVMQNDVGNLTYRQRSGFELVTIGGWIDHACFDRGFGME